MFSTLCKLSFLCVTAFFMCICKKVLVRICINTNMYLCEYVLVCVNSYYCDLVWIHTIITQTVDLIPYVLMRFDDLSLSLSSLMSESQETHVILPCWTGLESKETRILKNKEVLLRDGKRRTARGVASLALLSRGVPPVVFGGGAPCLVLTRAPPPPLPW